MAKKVNRQVMLRSVPVTGKLSQRELDALDNYRESPNPGTLHNAGLSFNNGKLVRFVPKG